MSVDKLLKDILREMIQRREYYENNSIFIKRRLVQTAIPFKLQ